MKSHLLFITLLTLLTSSFARADFDWNAALKLFDPKDAPPPASKGLKNGLGTWGDCLNKDWDYQPVTLDKKTKKLIAPCLPDTLYSWGHTIKLMSFLKEAAGVGAKAWDQAFPEMIYAHINPLATFGYGDFSIRMKLKNNVRFLYYGDDKIDLSQYCTKLLTSDDDRNNTVIIRSWAHDQTTGVDYILCSPGPLHSWSYGTKKHYDEIAASQLWNSALPDGNNTWISYTVTGSKRDLYDSGLDGYNWSSDIMLENFKTMRAMATEGLGQITYAPDVKADEAEHFKSKDKVYWHWQ